MSSREERRKRKILKGSYPQEEAVNTRGTVGAQSSFPAQVTERPGGDGTDLMEKVVERNNILRALDRVERNKGAAGVDGMEIKSLRPYLKEHWPRIKEELLTGTY